MPDAFWEQTEIVEQFAAREPDHRLAKLILEYPQPDRTVALDLGCAGGRNTVFLAGRHFDVYAIDASAAMVERTRERLSRIFGPEEARRRVLHGSMDDLSAFEAASIDLMVALGIFHNARTWAEWQRAIEEAARVLKPGGRLLVHHFTPEVDLTGEGVRPAPGEPDVYEGFPGGKVVLLDASRLDAALGGYGLRPEVASQTVRVGAPPGRRVGVNALYVRESAASSR